MTRLNKLMEYCPYNQLLITDTMMIQYFTGNHYEVGERFIGLVVRNNQAPLLILNSLFQKPVNLDYLYYSDGDNLESLLKSQITERVLAVDGTMAARFLIPLLNTYEIIDVSDYLHQCRSIKDNFEQELMVQASIHNDGAMNQVIQSIKLGMTEKELAQIARELQTTSPATHVSFDPIVLFGENTWDPHGIPSDRVLKQGDMVLIDMGGFINGYASDMTRCVFTGKNEKMEDIYNVVLEANLNAIAAVEVGKPLSDVDKAARDVINEAGYGSYFVHRTGHGIGMEAHESLDVSASNQTLIQNGMCFSIEPGIYIEGIGGVRIEDLVLVKDGRAQLLNNYPKKIEFIQI